jgi:hypothetical protein
VDERVRVERKMIDRLDQSSKALPPSRNSVLSRTAAAPDPGIAGP